MLFILHKLLEVSGLVFYPGGVNFILQLDSQYIIMVGFGAHFFPLYFNT